MAQNFSDMVEDLWRRLHDVELSAKSAFLTRWKVPGDAWTPTTMWWIVKPTLRIKMSVSPAVAVDWVAKGSASVGGAFRAMDALHLYG